MRADRPARPIVLGSASPRRREILANLGVAHRVLAADIDESVRAGEKPRDYLERVTLGKLVAVRAALANEAHAGGETPSAILVADTSVVLGDAILGKPASDEEGAAMLASLAGRTHEVMTRFAIGGRAGEQKGDGAGLLHAETVVTEVSFRPIDDDEITAYVATGEGRDKAGGYAAQGRASGFVSRIDGSYSCVVGLPACEVLVALRRLGLA